MESSGFLLDILAGLIALSIWLNWRAGYIKDFIDYVLKQKSFKTSIISFIILILPACIHYASKFVFSNNSIQRLISIFAPATILIPILKDYFDRKRIRKAIYRELILNSRNIYYLVTSYYLFADKCNNSNFHKSLENQWVSTVYEKYVDQIMSGSLIDPFSVDDWVDLYGKMKTAIDAIKNEISPFTNDEFLFKIFLGDGGTEIGVLADIRKIIESLDQDEIETPLFTQKDPLKPNTFIGS